MGEITGFLKYDRVDFEKENPETRVRNWNEFVHLLPEEKLTDQAARCMDCGVPFCHSGCPINNRIPDWNDLVYRGKWEEALKLLLQTNNFPEFTGRICPAPCENSCVLGITNPPVTIKNIEIEIIEKAYRSGWISANPPKHRTGKTVAVVGSGPAGLACADQLNKAGHSVIVFEKNEFAGGLLVLGIPNFKLEKSIVERRIRLMQEEGIEFRTNTIVGTDIPAETLTSEFDAVVLACGAEQPRDLPIPGRKLKGVHFAMEFLSLQNRVNLGAESKGSDLSAYGKNVVVLGGGDTGSDCIGTAIRQGAKSVKNFELLPRPPKERAADNPWPQWARIERISSSHEEGCERDFGILTKSFSGSNGRVEQLHAVRVEFVESGNGKKEMREIEGSEFSIETDMVLLALGFLGPKRNGLLEELNVELTNRGNVKTDENRMTSVPGVFAAGDMRRGQSLVVWAINEGRAAAEAVDKFLVSAGE